MLAKALFTLTLTVGLVSQAAETCFTATNPENIQITADDGKTLQTTEAKMSIQEAQSEENPGSMKMDIATASGEQVKVYAFDFNNSGGVEFRVECDGGGVSFVPGDKTLTGNTNYLAGEIVNYEGEGCNSVSIKMTQVQFAKNACTENSQEK